MAKRSIYLFLSFTLLFVTLTHNALPASASRLLSLSDQHDRRGKESKAAQAARRPLKVALQVGHWKNNELPKELSSLLGHTGAAGGGRTELELNMEMAGRVAVILRAAGIEVDILPATVQTGYTADAFIALHADGNSSTSSRGFKISTRWRSEVAMQDATLVDLLTEEYRAATGLPEDSNVTRNMRGYYAYASYRPNWRISNFTPGAIVEMGFMTNAADRAVMFGQTGKLAQGIASGITRFLGISYGGNGARTYGFGIVDKDINMDAPSFPRRTGAPSRVQTGDWQLFLMGPPTVQVLQSPGRNAATVGTLSKGRFYHSTSRNGDYYRVTLPDGKEGWVHRNAVVVQM